MGFGDLLWTIGIFISGCLFTFGVARTSELEFTAARNCFWLAPIPIAISDIWWEMTTKQPLWARLVISGVLGAVLLIGLGESLRWLTNKKASSQSAVPLQTARAETPSVASGANNSGASRTRKVDQLAKDEKIPPVNITGNENVVSIGQQGGITAKTVINQAVAPSLHVLGQQESNGADGSHTVVLTTEVRAPFTPGLLAIQVVASGLRSVGIVPPAIGGVSTIMLRNKRTSPNSYYAEIPSPRGQYIISITTEHRTDIQIGAQF